WPSVIPPRTSPIMEIPCRCIGAISAKRRFGRSVVALLQIALCAGFFPMIAARAAAAAPANDNFAAAQVISGLSGRVLGANVTATKEAGELPHPLNAGGKSIWYRRSEER